MAYSDPAERKAYAKGRADERKATIVQGAAITGRLAYKANMSSPGPVGDPRPSDQRFRSFAERYLIERAGTFRADNIAADTWQAILDAKRAYNMIKEVGRNAENDVGFDDKTL